MRRRVLDRRRRALEGRRASMRSTKMRAMFGPDRGRGGRLMILGGIGRRYV